MALILLHPAVDLTLELYVPLELEEAIAVQWERIRDHRVRQTYISALEARLQRLLADCLDWDLKEPTAAQVSFATLLARRHSVDLPREAQRSRFHMAMFIEEYSKRPCNGSGSQGPGAHEACDEGGSPSRTGST